VYDNGCACKNSCVNGQVSGRDIRVEVITLCQDIADCLDNGAKSDAIILDFSKVFDLVPHDRLLTKIAASGVDSKIVVWVREFCLSRTRRE
jgi:hypothetical protein